VGGEEFRRICTCACGATRFEVTGNPLTRFYCHCRICQSVYGQPFADVTVWWGTGVTLPRNHPVQFRRYRPPPALRRGICSDCGQPAVGFLSVLPFVALAFVPTRNFVDQSTLPPAAAHIFYHRRVRDVADDLPKHCGYWVSELAVARSVVYQAR
jgi:hypothetical protein